MVSTVSELELNCIDQMPRHQVVEAILANRDHLPEDLLERVEHRSFDYLRLLLLTSRLIRVLRRWQRQG